MKIAVWKTGHQIADTVADALARGINGHEVEVFQADNGCMERLAQDSAFGMGYGILRGMDEVIRKYEEQGKSFFHIDRGYINPGHFDGNYRISHKGTQAIYDEDFPVKGRTVQPIHPEPFKPYDKSKPVLICPPTEPVCQFFGIDKKTWELETTLELYKRQQTAKWREKGDSSPIPWDDISMVITFNSSVGWEAVRRGIPCLSDVNHSTVGSFYGETVTENLLEKFYSLDRMKLFQFMQAHQFTLDEIAQGDANWLIDYYLQRSSLGTMHGKPSVPMLRRTRFAGAHAQSPTSDS